MSIACLNDSDEQLVIFRNSDGKVLKSMGPRTAKLMTNSGNKAIPSSTYVPLTIYPTIPWQAKSWNVSFQYAPHIHNDVSLSSPLKGIEIKILQLLPVSEVLYSTCTLCNLPRSCPSRFERQIATTPSKRHQYVTLHCVQR